MDVLEHIDEQTSAVNESSEHTDMLGDRDDPKTGEVQQSPANEESSMDMDTWLASDEAAFWMSQ